MWKEIELKLIEPNDGQIEGLAKNPRQWTKDDFEKLRKSIEETPELMQARGLLTVEHRGKYVVLGGNMRLAVLKRMKARSVQAYVFPGNTPVEKLKEIVIKDNGSYGQWDFDSLANEWGDVDLSGWGVDIPDEWAGEMKNTEEAEEDDFDEENETIETRCRKGEVWLCGNHRLMCGDATSETDVAKLMAGEKADLIVTDPPYNVDYSSKNDFLNKMDKGNRVQIDIENDKLNNSNFKDFLEKAFSQLYSIAKEGCPVYVTIASTEMVNFINSMIGSGISYKQQLIWVKNCFVLGRQDYQWQHEPILYGWREGAAHYFVDEHNHATVIDDAMSIDPKKMTKGELAEWVSNVIESGIQTDVIKESKPTSNDLHPTMKPVKLFGRLIHNSSRIGDKVIDLFGGSGTTMIAAEQLGRKCYMMELDPHYCDVIMARWEKLTGQKAIKEE